MVAVKAFLFFSAARFVHDLWYGTPLGASITSSLSTTSLVPSLTSYHGGESSALTTSALKIRDIQFWSRATQIYSSYKWFQFTEAIANRTHSALSLRQPLPHHHHDTNREQRLKRLHAINSERMMKLCLDLRGFYLKSGQFLGTRHDFMPIEYISKLCQLHDDVPSLAGETVKVLIEKELQAPVEQYFESLNLMNPIGSASIAQVHRGVWKGLASRQHIGEGQVLGPEHGTRQEVAVKVQNPTVEQLMTNDLKNLKAIASFLTKRNEIAFDLTSAVEELQQQIKYEFDFRHEANNLRTIGYELMKRMSKRNVEVPTPIFATKKLLVMSYINGENLSKLQAKDSDTDRSRDRDSAMSWIRWFRPSVAANAWKDAIGKKTLLKKLAKMWAIQIFQLNAFHADPHPGNICLDRDTGRVGLFDWGQVKAITSEVQRNFANLIVAIIERDRTREYSGGSERIAKAFLNLGIQVQNSTDFASIETLALTMFDTRQQSLLPRASSIDQDSKQTNFEMNPFSSRSALKKNAVISMPRDIFFLLRTIQILRGYATALHIQGFSLANEWYDYAKDIVS